MAFVCNALAALVALLAVCLSTVPALAETSGNSNPGGKWILSSTYTFTGNPTSFVVTVPNNANDILVVFNGDVNLNQASPCNITLQGSNGGVTYSAGTGILSNGSAATSCEYSSIIIQNIKFANYSATGISGLYSLQAAPVSNNPIFTETNGATPNYLKFSLNSGGNFASGTYSVYYR